MPSVKVASHITLHDRRYYFTCWLLLFVRIRATETTCSDQSSATPAIPSTSKTPWIRYPCLAPYSILCGTWITSTAFLRDSTTSVPQCLPSLLSQELLSPSQTSSVTHQIQHLIILRRIKIMVITCPKNRKWDANIKRELWHRLTPEVLVVLCS